MSSFRIAAVAVFCCALSLISTVVASGGVVVFMDNQQGSYLRPGSQKVGKPWTPSTVGVSTAVLLGVPPLTTVDAEVSAELNELLVPQLFNRPQHVVSLIIVGNSAERAVDEVFSSSVQKRFLATPLQERAQTPSERTMAASLLVHEMAMVPLNAGKEVALFSLTCNADCDAQCVDIQQEKLAEMEGLGFTMEAAEDAAMGSFTFQGETFDLTQRADRALALEMACLLHHLSGVKVDGEKRSLFTGLLTSSQGMEEAYGEESSKAAAASLLLMKVVDHAIKAAQEAHSGRLVGSLALVGALPSSSLESLSASVEAGRSVRLLAQAAGSEDMGVQLINQVTMFTIGLILLITTGLATCALCCMPITRETLLYSGVKLD